jgi:chitin synthase
MSHEYVLECMDLDPRFPLDAFGEPESFNYVAIAGGNKRKNFAQVYVGHYRSSLPEQRVPMVLVVKVGNEEERDEAKPGNRGKVCARIIKLKRDSQVLLMTFLSKVMFDERMTELEFDIFFKLWTISGVHPDMYEAVLLVDADTILNQNSISHLVAALIRDPLVIGACGETRITNKFDSWVTMIQVFEYFISHHLNKV